MNACAQTGRKVTVIPPIAEMQGESRIDMRPKRVPHTAAFQQTGKNRSTALKRRKPCIPK